MSLSTRLKPQLESVIVEVRAREGLTDPELRHRYAMMLQQVMDAVGLDIVRDAPEIYQGSYVLFRAQSNPITLQVVYTQDGKPIEDPLTWEPAPSANAPLVYFERYNLSTGARLGHGWVDPVTRRLVQTG